MATDFTLQWDFNIQVGKSLSNILDQCRGDNIEVIFYAKEFNNDKSDTYRQLNANRTRRSYLCYSIRIIKTGDITVLNVKRLTKLLLLLLKHIITCNLLQSLVQTCLYVVSQQWVY